MPRVHRDTDVRFCSAKTIVRLQTKVFVNNLLWAVQGDIDDHCNAGPLIAIYGLLNVRINNILCICAVGDAAGTDIFDCKVSHGPAITRPLGASPNTYIYALVGGIAGA